MADKDLASYETGLSTKIFFLNNFSHFRLKTNLTTFRYENIFENTYLIINQCLLKKNYRYLFVILHAPILILRSEILQSDIE